MKYCVLIIDGAADWPLPGREQKTCLELASTPNLDRMAREGTIGLIQTVPEGMEPSSACACMSIIGYDPRIYYRGRSAIEAVSMDIPINEDESVFRCNLISVRDGKMWDYSAGHISDDEARSIVHTLEERLGNETIHFYSGVGYRHICKINGHPEILSAICTPPHDIPGKPVGDYLPQGTGSDLLRKLMERSIDILRDHPVNKAREARGDIPATMIWLFWGSGMIPQLPPFREVYGLKAAMTSGVDLLRGLAKMAGIENLDIVGITAGLDNDYTAQSAGALKALQLYDIVFIHIEAPDEAAHTGNIDGKIAAISSIDREVVGSILSMAQYDLRILALPDHATPIAIQTHAADPVPFVLWGPGFQASGVRRFNEAEAKRTGITINDGYGIISRLIQ